MIRNLNWYALNEQRPYPFDDSATLLTDNGKRLEHDYITDVFLRFPETAGNSAFLCGFSCTSTIVTAVFVSESTVPLASVSIAQPIVEGKHYALDSLYPGAGGWIVFGSGAVKGREASYRFSTAQQALLLARAARRYKGLPVESLQAEGTLEALTGLVRLVGGNDIEIVTEDRVIEGVVREAIVIRLKDKLGGAGQLDRNILEEYLGACDRRPESRNCGQPEPIEFINSVKPDCCGNITIELQGCGFYVPISGSCGIVMTCDFGLGDACVTKSRLPDVDGKLANEYDDICESFSSSLPLDDDEEETPSFSMPDPDASVSESVFVDNLPYIETFNAMSAADFTVKEGDFDFDNVGGQAAWTTNTSEGRSRKNLAVWTDGIPEQGDWTTLYKRVTVDIHLTSGPSGTLHNGGIAFNYRPLVGGGGFTYWTAELDWEGHFGSGAKVLRIGRFTGTATNTLLSAQLTNLSLNEWYRLTLTLYDVDNNNAAWALVQVDELTGPNVSASVGPVYLPNYYPHTGLFGLTSYRSTAAFDNFTVSNEIP